MEHAEYISDAVSFVKQAFMHIDGIITWVKLFLAITIPFLAGTALATLILQFLIKPLLVGLLVTPNLGFTEGGISHILQYLAVLIGMLFPLIFPIYQGYLYTCMQSRKIPGTENLFGYFFTGWKTNILLLYYAIPLIVIFILYAILFTFITGALDLIVARDISRFASVIDYASLTGYLVLEFATFLFLALFACIGLVHIARTGSLKQSVNMGNIADIIRRIGWYNYILCIMIVTILILTTVVLFLILASIFDFAVAANIIFAALFIFVMIPIGVFAVRYLSNVYDAAFIEEEEDIEEFDDF